MSIQRSSATLRCDPSLIYEILTDYDAYADWLPGIAQAKSLATEGDLAIAEFHFTAPRKERFVVECIHTRNKMVLWRKIEGNVPISQIEWEITSSGAGQGQVSLAVSGAGSFNPFHAGPGKFLNASRAVKALQGQTASFVPELGIADGSGEKILELSETDDGIVCWIRGKKYVLKES